MRSFSIHFTVDGLDYRKQRRDTTRSTTPNVSKYTKTYQRLKS